MSSLGHLLRPLECIGKSEQDVNEIGIYNKVIWIKQHVIFRIAIRIVNNFSP